MTIAIAETILIFAISISLVLYMLLDRTFAWRPSLQAEHLISIAVAVPLVIMAMVGVYWLGGSFRSGGQTDWSQIKDFVQACVLLVTPTGVLLGLHFAKQRTDAMQTQNNIQLRHNDDQSSIWQRQFEQMQVESKEQRRKEINELFSEAFNQLRSGEKMDFFDAVRKLKELAEADDNRHLQRAVDYLADFVKARSQRTTTSPLNFIQQAGSRSNIQRALDTICEIMEKAKEPPLVILDGSNLRGLTIRRAHPRISLQGCDLAEVRIIFHPFSSENIEHYFQLNLSHAFVLGDLRNVSLGVCEISGTDFSNANNMPVNSLTSCVYLAATPPLGIPARSNFRHDGLSSIQLEHDEPIVIALPRMNLGPMLLRDTLADWQTRWESGQFPEPLTREGGKLSYHDPLALIMEMAQKAE